MKKIKAVVFDIGGVLVDNMDIKSFWKELSESRKLRDEFGAGVISEEQFISNGADLLGITKKEFLKKYKKEYSIINLKKDVLILFRKIKIDKYILSDSNPIAAIRIKKMLQEEFRMTQKTFLSHEIGLRKINPKTFDFLIKQIGFNPKNILFIDDTRENIKRAKKAGINTILFKDVNQLIKNLKHFGIDLS